MKKEFSTHVVFVGTDEHNFETIANIRDDLDINLVKRKTLSLLPGSHPPFETIALFIIDISNDEKLSEALRVLENHCLDNTSFLVLVDKKCDKKDLLRRCETAALDCLIKPLVKELFIARVKQFINAFKLKLSLEQEAKERDKVISSLLDEKRYSESLINSSMDMIISVDLDRNIFEFNLRAQETFGYSKDEILGKPVDLLYAHKDQSVNVYKNTIKKHRYSTEIINRRKNGEKFPSLISASILVERGGKTIGLMGISRDISDFKRVEKDLKKAKETAEAANQAKSEFLANMSHEIRTPMTSVIGYAELIEDRLPENSELFEFVGSIKRNGQHLLQLINDILDLSQVEKGKLALHYVYCSPANIITNLYHIICGRSEDKGVSIEINYLDEIPKFIYSDPTRILQCLVNLVGNAIKFSHKGNSVTISVEYLPNGIEPLLQFQVKDTGIGIPEKQLSSIMEPFEQGDIPVEILSEGVGLGLSITRRLADLLGGSLSVESRHKVGSTFTINIKCNLNAQEIELVDIKGIDMPNDDRVEDIPKGQDVPLLGTLNGKILLAEDNTDIRKLVTKILSDAGAIVDAVEAGPPVLEKVPNEVYDLILMDMQLPLMDGMTVVRKLRKNGYKKPIIALTASAMGERLKSFLKGGCDECAVKPISRFELIELARKWIECGKQTVKSSKLSTPKRQRGEDELPKMQKRGRKKRRFLAKKIGKPARSFQNLIYSSYHSDPDMQEIVKEYVHTLPVKRENIISAHNNDDFQALRKIVHGLHGSGGGFGFDILSKYGGEIERMIDGDHDKNEIASVLQELQDVINRIISTYNSS